MADQPVVLTRRGILHLYPAFEPCNIDDAEEHTIFLSGADTARADPRYRRDCRRCAYRLERDLA